MTIAIVTRISKAMKFIFCNKSMSFDCNKHLRLEIVLFFAYCFNYEFLEIYFIYYSNNFET